MSSPKRASVDSASLIPSMFRRKSKMADDASADENNEWEVGCRYDLLFPATIRTEAELQSLLVGEICKGTNVLLMSRQQASRPNGTPVLRGMVMTPDGTTGWCSLEDSKRIKLLAQTPSKDSWRIGSHYRVLGACILRSDKALDSESLREISPKEEVVIIGFGVAERLDGAKKGMYTLRAQVSTRDDLVGWLSCVGSTGQQFLETSDLLEADLKQLRKEDEKLGLVQVSGRGSLKKTMHRASLTTNQWSTIPWKVGGKYRVTNDMVMQLSKDPSSKKVIDIPKNDSVIVEKIENLGTNVTSSMIRALVHADAQGITGWVTVEAKGKSALDTRDHLEINKVQQRLAESESNAAGGYPASDSVGELRQSSFRTPARSSVMLTGSQAPGELKRCSVSRTSEFSWWGELLKEGVIEKRSSSVMKGLPWQMRAFRVYDQAVLYSDSSKWNPKAKQCITLKSIVEVHLSTKPGRDFRIITKSKSYRLRAGVFAEAQNWVDAMDRAARALGITLTIKGFVSEAELEEKNIAEAKHEESKAEALEDACVTELEWSEWQRKSLAHFERLPASDPLLDGRNLGDGGPGKDMPHFMLFKNDPCPLILATCKEMHTKYVDPEYNIHGSSACDDHELFQDPYLIWDDDQPNENRVWRRPDEIAKQRKRYLEVCLFGSSEGSLGHIVKGSSPCWLYLVVHAIAGRYPDIIRDMFNPREFSPEGVYSVRLHVNGAPCYILIDDLLPCNSSNSRPEFMHCEDSSEFWCSLLGKALAKWGSFINLDDGIGSKQYVMRAICGGEQVGAFCWGACGSSPFLDFMPSEYVKMQLLSMWKAGYVVIAESFVLRDPDPMSLDADDPDEESCAVLFLGSLAGEEIVLLQNATGADAGYLAHALPSTWPQLQVCIKELKKLNIRCPEETGDDPDNPYYVPSNPLDPQGLYLMLLNDFVKHFWRTTYCSPSSTVKMSLGPCELWTKARDGLRSDALEPAVIQSLGEAWKKYPDVFTLRPTDLVVLGKNIYKHTWSEGCPPRWMELDGCARPEGGSGNVTEYRVTTNFDSEDSTFRLLLCTNWSDRPVRVRVNGEEVAVVSQDSAKGACVDELCNGFGAWYDYPDVQFTLKAGENSIEFAADAFSPWINAFILRPLERVRIWSASES